MVEVTRGAVLDSDDIVETAVTRGHERLHGEEHRRATECESREQQANRGIESNGRAACRLVDDAAKNCAKDAKRTCCACEGRTKPADLTGTGVATTTHRVRFDRAGAKD